MTRAASQPSPFFGDRAPVEVKTVFGFGGKASSTLTVGAVEFNDPSSHVKTTPLVVSADVDGQGRLHGYRLRWDEVNAKFQGEKAGELKVSGVDFSATTQPLGTSPWLYGGDGTGVIRQVTFTPQAGSTAFALNDLKIKSHTGVQGETLEASTEMSAALKVGVVRAQSVAGLVLEHEGSSGGGQHCGGDRDFEFRGGHK